MKRHILFIPFVIYCLLFTASSLPAQQSPRQSKIGYVYPAGGQRGTTVEVLIGGRQIARSSGVIISGSGVTGRIVRSYPSMTIIGGDDQRVARQIYDEARKRVESGRPTAPSEERNVERRSVDAARRKLEEEALKKTGQPPVSEDQALPKPEEIIRRYLYFDRLAGNPTEDDLQLVFYEHFAPRPDRKPKDAFNQGVAVEITIDADAEPGDRDLRLSLPNGLTPPVRFVVGTLPEVRELEPNDTDVASRNVSELWGRRVGNAPKTIRQLHTLDLPVVINGQIRTSDVDRFTFNAKKGQKLVIAVQARHLNPYLADAVPGWFQASITLFGPGGEKMGGAASYRFDPDPVMLFEVPKTGVYALEIQDSIFRGRDDFVYRISIGETPFVTSVFPLGGRRGNATGADVDGWNLPEKHIVLDMDQPGPSIRTKSFLGKVPLTWPIRFAVDDLPEIIESKSKETPEKVTLPVIVNGRIDTISEVDRYSFQGRKGQRVVLDVAARSLNSPLDASLELLDPAGKIIAANDDRADSKGPNIGLETHHADPYLNVELPEDGVYTVRLFNTMQRGGKEYAYRLRISEPRPDFAVYFEPASLSLSGPTHPITVHVFRKDGFDGKIVIRLGKSAEDAGFTLDGATIPAGNDHGTVTLGVPKKYDGMPRMLYLEGVTSIGGQTLVHPVIAVDDWEQAFIYHHLVPVKSLMISGTRRR